MGFQAGSNPNAAQQKWSLLAGESLQSLEHVRIANSVAWAVPPLGAASRPPARAFRCRDWTATIMLAGVAAKVLAGDVESKAA
jgi:hypothetical protein